MLKTLLFVAVGLVAGLGLALLWQGEGAGDAVEIAGPTSTAAPAVRAAANGDPAERVAALETALAEESAKRVELESRVSELADELAALTTPSFSEGGDRPEAPPGAVAGRGRFDPARRQAESERRLVERLTAAGFAPDRAEWINRRTSELRMEALQAEYEARRQGDGQTALPLARTMELEGSLRADLGDADYERYLEALGRPTRVGVQSVLASSPAERAGLKPGDEVLAYGGQRVFNMRELNDLIYEGNGGDSVVVDIVRDGQPLQIVLPRGPIGVVAGGFRGR
jgi:hypothetical protein